MAISFTTVVGSQSVANPLTRAYASAVASGDVLVAFVSIYNASETCTGVSDSINGAWTQSFGPINAGNGTRLYGFYKLNSGAGTPTVTANFSSTNHHELSICAISGLSGGGAFDQQASSANLSTNPSVGPTTTLGAAVCAAIAGQTNSGVTPTAYGAGWTLNSNLDLGWQKTSFIQQETSSNSAITASWTQGNSYWNAGLMVFKDAGGGNAIIPCNTGSTSASGFTASILAATVISCAIGGASATGNAASIVASGGASIVSSAFKNNTGTILASTAISKVAAIKLSDLTLAATWSNQTTNGSGVLTVSNAGLTAATEYLLVASNADGSSVGVKKYTAS